jgi:hypothetical protein
MLSLVQRYFFHSHLIRQHQKTQFSVRFPNSEQKAVTLIFYKQDVAMMQMLVGFFSMPIPNELESMIMDYMDIQPRKWRCVFQCSFDLSKPKDKQETILLYNSLKNQLQKGKLPLVENGSNQCLNLIVSNYSYQESGTNAWLQVDGFVFKDKDRKKMPTNIFPLMMRQIW